MEVYILPSGNFMSIIEPCLMTVREFGNVSRNTKVYAVAIADDDEYTILKYDREVPIAKAKVLNDIEEYTLSKEYKGIIRLVNTIRYILNITKTEGERS